MWSIFRSLGEDYYVTGQFLGMVIFLLYPLPIYSWPLHCPSDLSTAWAGPSRHTCSHLPVLGTQEPSSHLPWVRVVTFEEKYECAFNVFPLCLVLLSHTDCTAVSLTLREVGKKPRTNSRQRDRTKPWRTSSTLPPGRNRTASWDPDAQGYPGCRFWKGPSEAAELFMHFAVWDWCWLQSPSLNKSRVDDRGVQWGDIRETKLLAFCWAVRKPDPWRPSHFKWRYICINQTKQNHDSYGEKATFQRNGIHLSFPLMVEYWDHFF